MLKDEPISIWPRGPLGACLAAALLTAALAGCGAQIDRKVVAVYFNGQSSVVYVAQYGLKDGIVVRYAKDETPARGKDLGLLEQLFGNISQRKMFKDQRQQGIPGSIPGGGP